MARQSLISLTRHFPAAKVTSLCTAALGGTPDNILQIELCCSVQPCLGGDGKTLMFVNINCAPDSAKETLCSLRFAAKVNQCETGAKGGARKHVSELTAEPHASSAAEVGSSTVQNNCQQPFAAWFIYASDLVLAGGIVCVTCDNRYKLLAATCTQMVCPEKQARWLHLDAPDVCLLTQDCT